MLLPSLRIASGGVGEALGFKDGMRRGPVSSIVVASSTSAAASMA
jgi:hypothetical protein